MTKDTELLLKEYKKEYRNYKNFIDSNEWFEDVRVGPDGKLGSSKLSTEISIIDTIIKGTTKFKSDIGEDIEKKPVQEFIKFTADIINEHIGRVQYYKKIHPLSDESTESDVKFHSDLFALITKTKVSLSKLEIDENEQSKKSVDLFFSNTKAPLAMRELLCDTFPIVKEKTEKTGLDFYAPSLNPATSNEMFVNMKPKDIPKWDTNKHFFEQETSTIQFWEEEIRKIKNGINIYGYPISNWLYWHLNHYKLAYIEEETGNKIIDTPLLRDNEYYFDEMYKKAEENGKVGLFMYGTRRFTKTVLLSSRSLHGLYTIPKCQATVQGYTETPDLKAIIDYISDAVENMNPALKIPANSMDLKEGAILGLKGKRPQDRFDLSRLSVVNLEGGTTKKGTQKTAAATPDVFVFDELAKGPCIAPWKAAIPSFAGGKKGKWRTVPMLAATAGDSILSLDAETMLKNPTGYNILPMDWDLLESITDPEYITWTRNSFGMFIPAQFSLEAPPKIDKSLSEFLNIENPGLDDINIKVTDWAASKEYFESERNKKSNDIQMLASYTNSFPLEVEDCYLTTEINKYPGLECKHRKSYIEREGLDGAKYRLYKDSNGSIQAEMTPNDPVITEYPYKGGNFDAPVVMLENPLLFPEKPPLGLYVMGLDDIKQDSSNGDSVASATVYKRGFEGGEWADRIVAWYDSRPDKKRDYYRQLYLLMKIYNARILFENEDNGFIEWVESNHPEDVHIHFSTGVGLASEENLHRNTNRKFGWTPTGQNIYLAEQKVVMYTKEDGIVIGDTTDLTGVDRINHPMLLEELYKYKKGQNADRLRSFSLALTLARYYDNTYQYMKYRRKRSDDDENSRRKSNRNVKSSKGIMYDKRLK